MSYRIIESEPMKDKQLLLNKIVQNLMLRTSSISDLGLLSGKMGVCIFFYRYARHTEVKRYADFAGELLDEIYAEINTGITKDFGKGLAGICWGIEYLVHQGFVDADANDVLGDMDPLILERDVRRMADTSLETGLEGLAHYALARCSGKQKRSLDDQYIAELAHCMESRGCTPVMTVKLGVMLRGKIVEYEFGLIDNIAAHGRYTGAHLSKETNIGISKNGLAGIALQMINRKAR